MKKLFLIVILLFSSSMSIAEQSIFLFYNHSDFEKVEKHGRTGIGYTFNLDDVKAIDIFYVNEDFGFTIKAMFKNNKYAYNFGIGQLKTHATRNVAYYDDVSLNHRKNCVNKRKAELKDSDNANIIFIEIEYNKRYFIRYSKINSHFEFNKDNELDSDDNMLWVGIKFNL